MRSGIYPDTFLNKIVYHKQKGIFYQITHLPKRYTEESKTHNGEYYTTVERLTDNKSNQRASTVLHINKNSIKDIILMEHKHGLDKETLQKEIEKNKNNKEYFKTNLMIDELLTKDFKEYINDIHNGV